MKRSIQLLRAGLVGSLLAATASSQTLIYETFGDTTADYHGTAVASAGDLNLDGHDDVLIGAPTYHDPATLEKLGRAQVISGSDGSELFAVFGLQEGGSFGSAVAGVGDLDEDGHDDFAVGAPLDDEVGWNHGAVYVYSGVDGALLWAVFGPPPAFGTASQFGRAIAGRVDVDADGHDDVLVGAPYAGLVYCFSRTGSLQSTISGPANSGLFGWSLDGVGDVDGDGFDEVVIGDPFAQTATGEANGSATVYSFATLAAVATVYGPELGCRFGHSVAGVGDLTGEGIPDIVVGAPYFANESGRVVAMLGESGWPIHFRDGAGGVRLGHAVSGLGDVDHDGVRDYLVGAPFADPGGLSFAGQTQALSGATGLPIVAWTGTTEGETFGWSVASAGFINADLIPDVVIGARDYDGPGQAVGAARIYLMNSPTPAAYCSALPNSQGCDSAIAFSGAPSAESGDNFVVTARDVLNNQFGILFWGYEEADIPFGGGTLCVTPPIVRTPVQHSGGSAAGADCSGTYAFHFSHAYLEEMAVLPGQTLYCQFWSRDPFLMPHGIGLTDALGFQVVP